MDVKIRIMEKGDVEFCTKIVTELLNEPEDVTRETLEDYYDDEQESSLMLVALLDNKPVGLAGILIEGWNASGIIEWIGILEEHRRKKIGSKLLKELIEYSKKHNVRKIYVDTGVTNIAAIIFYIKNEFYPDAILKDYYIDGKDALKFAYKL